MKPILLLALMVLGTLPMQAATTNTIPSNAEQEQLFMEAVMLYSRGFYAEAEGRLKRLAEWQPSQTTISSLLREVQAKLKQRDQDPVRLLKRKLATIVFPSVQFRAAKPEEVIDFIRQESGKLADDKTEINFVWQVPADLVVPPITLNLKNIPLPEVLTYVTELAGLRYRVDPYAVIIYRPEPLQAEPHVKPE